MKSSWVWWPQGRFFCLESGRLHAAQKTRPTNKELGKTDWFWKSKTKGLDGMRSRLSPPLTTATHSAST